MTKRYLLLALRNLFKHRATFLINIIGLSGGLTCAILISLWIRSELAVDNFHENKVLQIIQNEHLKDAINTVEGTPGPLAATLKAEFIEVKDATTASPILWLGRSAVGKEQIANVRAAGKFAGTDFFKIFSYGLLHGDPEQVLSGKNTIVVSQSLAQKLYGTTHVVGRPMVWSNAEMQLNQHAVISGVFKDIPEASSEQFDFLVSTNVLFELAGSTYKQWQNYGPHTYVVLHKDADLNAFNAKIKSLLSAKGIKNHTLFARDYSRGYLYDKLENGSEVGGKIDNVKLLGVAALLVLVVACINFTNLSTASASRRLKEIGVQKALGASRGNLVLQFLSESIVITFFALFVSLLATELLLPLFGSLTGRTISLSFDGEMVIGLVLLALLTGITAGAYPALYLSGIRPVNALKGKLAYRTGTLWLRQGLVVFQFAFSVVLIVGVLVVSSQMRMVQHKGSGFEKENVFYFETEGLFKANPAAFIKVVRGMDGVVGAGGMDRELLGDLSYTTGSFSWEGRDPSEYLKFQRADVSAGLIEALGMKMVAGRTFNEQLVADTGRVIINQAGIRAMHLKNPVGKIFTLWGKQMQIIGVVEDFHFEPLHKVIGPMFIRYKPAQINRIMVRTAPGKMVEVIKQFRAMEKVKNSGYQTEIRFLDDDFQQQYLSEQRVSVLSKYFAATALLVSCLGLLGLVAFASKRRFKEVGIRKVLGATDSELMLALSGDFFRPMAVALLVALPVAYMLSIKWLSTFAYRIELHWWYLALAGGAALVVAFSTVFYQTYKAAKVAPVVSLKTE